MASVVVLIVCWSIFAFQSYPLLTYYNLCFIIIVFITSTWQAMLFAIRFSVWTFYLSRRIIFIVILYKKNLNYNFAPRLVA